METRKVIIHVRLNGAPGRNQLNGVFRFLGRTTHWNIRLTQSEAELIGELQAALDDDDRPDGFIIAAPLSDRTCALLSKLREPTVLIDIPPRRIRGRGENLAFVQNDNTGIGIAAARHLAALGSFRSFAFVHAKEPSPWSKRRCESFSGWIRQHGGSCATYEANVRSPSEDRRLLMEFLCHLKRPAAIFAAWDGRATQILECAHTARIDIPKEMALLGVDDDIICEHTNPPLASIRPDNEQEGYSAAQTLDQMLRKKKWPKSTLCPMNGISERESASAIAPGGHLVRRALEFIEKNKTRAITASDVVQHLGISRRLADHRFHQFQHETILEAITRIRLKEVQRRLRSSDLPIDRIAQDCGFSDSSYLMTLFRRKFGVTMREWRRDGR